MTWLFRLLASHPTLSGMSSAGALPRSAAKGASVTQVEICAGSPEKCP